MFHFLFIEIDDLTLANSTDNAAAIRTVNVSNSNIPKDHRFHKYIMAPITDTLLKLKAFI